jgi:hypothetical protein
MYIKRRSFFFIFGPEPGPSSGKRHCPDPHSRNAEGKISFTQQFTLNMP